MHNIQLSILEMFGIIAFIVFIIVTARHYASVRLSNSVLKKIFLAAIIFRLITSLVYSFSHVYLFNEGDLITYYESSDIIWNSFQYDPKITIELFDIDKTTHKRAYGKEYEVYANTLRSEASIFMMKFIGLLRILFLNSFFVVSMIFGLFAFLGNWLLFKLFVQYSNFENLWIYSICLFVPSVLFFSSAIGKDSLVVGGLGFLAYGAITILDKKRLSLKLIALTLIGLFFIISVKPYVLFAFIPAAAVWFFIRYRSDIQKRLILMVNAPLIILLVLGISYFLVHSIMTNYDDYDTQYLFKMMDLRQREQIKASSANNSYTLDIEHNYLSLAKNGPKAIFIALFKPFIWETRSGLILLYALENLIMLLCVLLLFVKQGPLQLIKSVFKNPLLSFAFVFIILLSAIIGFSAYNYGALARLKSPAQICMVYFTVHLFIMSKNRKVFKKPARVLLAD